MKVIDFSGVSAGTLVTRSAHWNKQRAVKAGARQQIGVIVKIEGFMSADGRRVIAWPCVHWEGAPHDSVTHPANVAFYRKQRGVKYVEMDEDSD